MPSLMAQTQTGSEFINAYKAEGSIAQAEGIEEVINFITSATPAATGKCPI